MVKVAGFAPDELIIPANSIEFAVAFVRFPVEPDVTAVPVLVASSPVVNGELVLHPLTLWTQIVASELPVLLVAVTVVMDADAFAKYQQDIPIPVVDVLRTLPAFVHPAEPKLSVTVASIAEVPYSPKNTTSNSPADGLIVADKVDVVPEFFAAPVTVIEPLAAEAL